jgi:hypothetical protein
MSFRQQQTPHTGISAEERAVFKRLAPLRVTLERYVRGIHARIPTSTEDAFNADCEILWTLMLESYSRGVGNLRRGLQQGEGVDHEMLDEAITFALEKGKTP